MDLQLIPRISRKVRRLGSLITGRDDITGRKPEARPDLARIGSRRGGWVVPTSLLNADSVCYCVGCGDDISFDLGLINRFGCEVYAFDPTPRAIQFVHETARNYAKYHLAEIGVWDKTDTLKFFAPQFPPYFSYSALNLQKTSEYLEARVERLADIMAANHHTRLDLLKLDVEGAEYRVIESILQDELEIKILCVEYDEYYNPIDKMYKSRIGQSVNRLIANGYVMVCAQGYANYTFVKT